MHKETVPDRFLDNLTILLVVWGFLKMYCKPGSSKKNSWGACYADFGLYTPEIDLKGQGALESAFSSSSPGDYKCIWSTVYTLKKPLPKIKDPLSTMEINMFFIPAKIRVSEQKGI